MFHVLKRFRIRMIGPSTNDRWVTIFECKTRQTALRHFRQWEETHGVDHTIFVMDTKAHKNQSIVYSVNGAQINYL